MAPLVKLLWGLKLETIWDAKWSPQGDKIAVACECEGKNKVLILDLNGKIMETINIEGKLVEFSHDGSILAISDSINLVLYNVEKGASILRYEHVVGGEKVTSIAWSSRGNLIALGDRGGTLHIYKLKDTGKLEPLWSKVVFRKEAIAQPYGVLFSHKGEKILVFSSGALKILDVHSRRTIWSQKGCPLRGASWSWNDSLIALAYIDELRVVDANNGKFLTYLGTQVSDVDWYTDYLVISSNTITSKKIMIFKMKGSLQMIAKAETWPMYVAYVKTNPKKPALLAWQQGGLMRAYKLVIK